MKKLLLSITLFSAMITAATLTQGCLVAAIGAGVGAAKMGSAKQKAAYASYVTEMEKINLEREKANLKTRPIMTYEEWHKGKGKPEEKAPPEKK